MSKAIDNLRKQVEAAAHALDFETARRLRDQICLMRGGVAASDVENLDMSGLMRQQAGKMGLGTSRQRGTPPTGWTPPEKPDPMT